MSLTQAFTNFADSHKGKVVQLALRGVPAPFHGELQPYWILGREDGMPDAYQIIVEAQLGPGAPVRKMPFVFDSTDVLWFSTGLIDEPAAKSSLVWNS